MKTRQFVIIGSALAIVALSYFSMKYFASLKKEPTKKPKQEVRKSVFTEKVVYSDIQTSIVAFGRVESAQPLDLVSEVSGRISMGNVPIKAGQNFRKGQLLFTVEDPQEELKLKADKSNYLKMIASILPDFKVDFSKSYSTWQAYFSTIELDKPLPELPQVSDQAEKTYLATRDIFSTYYQIKSTEERLKKYTIYAPYNGSFAEVMMEVGSVVSTGSRIARVIRTDQLELKVPVEASEITWVRQGTLANISTEDGRQQWEGRVTRVGDIVNQNTQSIDVFITLKPNEYPVFDGLYLRAEIPGGIVKDAMIVARNAVFNGNKVYIVEQDSVLKVKEIDVHKVNQETIVFSGLPEQADLVNEPLVNAYNNMKVNKLSEGTRLKNARASIESTTGSENGGQAETSM